MLSIIVDHREKGLKELFDCGESLLKYDVRYENLELGDVHICKQHNEHMLKYVFERKTLSDLLQSIHDGRYHNQKKRLMESYAVHQLAYIIEGCVSYAKEDAAVLSAIINTCLRDRIMIFQTVSTKETYRFVLELAKRLDESPHKYVVDGVVIGNGGGEVQPPKGNKREDTWINMLCQIQGVSLKTAKAIASEYPSLFKMYATLSSCSQNEKLNKLKSIKTTDSKGSSRKIAGTVAANILNALYDQDGNAS